MEPDLTAESMKKEPTKNQLAKRAGELRELVRTGEATLSEAEELHRTEKQLRRIERIRNGTAW